jgi:hypothetical protein
MLLTRGAQNLTVALCTSARAAGKNAYAGIEKGSRMLHIPHLFIAFQFPVDCANVYLQFHILTINLKLRKVDCRQWHSRRLIPV